MWIKICGITSIEDAESAIAAGADAIGFVFARSPRRVAPEDVRKITATLPKSVEKIGVFVDASLEEMTTVCRLAGLNGVQLHGSRCLNLQSLCVGDLSGPMRVLQVVRYHVDRDRFAMELQRLHEWVDGQQDAVLVDTWSASKQGGTGVAFDWGAARDSFRREAPHLRLVAAGGLNPENVQEAIRILRPWGIDVSSGVESSPGRKDSRLVTAFIRAARAVEMEPMETARV